MELERLDPERGRFEGYEAHAGSEEGLLRDMQAGLLASKLREIYPEVDRYGLDLYVSFVVEKDAWLVTLAKGHDTMTTHLERKDADACLEGIQCVYLGVQIGQFVANFKEAVHLVS